MSKHVATFNTRAAPKLIFCKDYITVKRSKLRAIIFIDLVTIWLNVSAYAIIWPKQTKVSLFTITV
jgi:hypothetical protein